jgi:hypothetical protein
MEEGHTTLQCEVSAITQCQLRKAHGIEPLEVVSPETLAQSQRWEHHVGVEGVHITITLANRHQLCNNAIQGVLNRLVSVPYEPLLWADPVAREYASQELTAFFMSWLYALSQPVINQPTPQGLAGQWRHRSEWLWLAARAGLPTPFYRQTSHDYGDTRDRQGRFVSPDTAVQTVFAVADSVVSLFFERLHGVGRCLGPGGEYHGTPAKPVWLSCPSDGTGAWNAL